MQFLIFRFITLIKSLKNYFRWTSVSIDLLDVHVYIDNILWKKADKANCSIFLIRLDRTDRE